MEHTYAVREQVAERYFLGELSAAEVDAFEAHYFECAACAEYVREELAMLEHGKDVARESRPAEVKPAAAARTVPASKRAAPRWVPAAIAAALAVAITIPVVTFSTRPLAGGRPQIVMIEPGVARSEESGATAAEGAPVSLRVGIPARDAGEYVVTVRRGTRAIASETFTGEEISEPVEVVFGELPAGSYEVEVDGVGSDGKRTPIYTTTVTVREEE